MKIDSKEFKAAVDAVSPVVRAKSPLPILSHIKVVSTGDRLSFTASNIDSQIEYWIDCHGEKFAGCIDGHALKRFAQFCEGEVSMTIKNKKAVLEFGDTKTRLNTLPDQDFPTLEKAGAAITEIEWAPLGGRIAFASQFCGIHASSPQMSCVQVNSTGTLIEVFGTDGKSLGIQSIPHIAPEFGLCIPVETARCMVGDFKTMTVRDAQVELRGDNSVALFKTSPYKPMAISRILSLTLPDSGSFARKSLTDAISFVGSFGDSGKLRSSVRIQAGNDSVVSLIGRENEATAPFEYEGEPFSFGAYHDDFATFLKALTGDKLKLQFDKSNEARTQIRLSDGDRLICTMPVSL